MNRTRITQTLKSVMITLKPWLVTIALVLILRYTGALSGLSVLTQTAVMKTGFLDADTDVDESREQKFDYNFKLKDLQGNSLSVADLKGKVIFLNLWATWCGPCRVEMPSIESLYKSVDKDEIVFVMLSIDNPESFKKVVNYVSDKGYTFPVYVPEKYLTNQLQVPSIPTTFIIGKDGMIKRKEVGAANYDTEKFRAFLRELVEK